MFGPVLRAARLDRSGSPALAVLLAVLFDLFWFNVAGLWHGFHVEGVPYWRDAAREPERRRTSWVLGFVILATIQLVRGADQGPATARPAASGPNRSRRSGARFSASRSETSGWGPLSGSRS
jgi:hypothetical protein